MYTLKCVHFCPVSRSRHGSHHAGSRVIKQAHGLTALVKLICSALNVSYFRRHIFCIVIYTLDYGRLMELVNIYSPYR